MELKRQVKSIITLLREQKEMIYCNFVSQGYENAQLSSPSGETDVGGKVGTFQYITQSKTI